MHRLSRARRLVLTPWGVVLAFAAVAGIVLRVWAYNSSVGVPTSDDGVVGLIALHAMHGRFTTFFWGQAYGGSQEALLAAPLFWIFGPGWLALRIVPIVLTAITAIVLWRVGRRTIGERAGAVAGALFWVWPPYAIFKLTHEHGFYASGVLYVALLLLLALRIVERPDRMRVGLFGLVLGLAFWQTPQIVPIAVPLIAWTVWKKPAALRHVWIAAPLLALGALPWTVFNLHHGWESLTMTSEGGKTYAHRLRIFASPLLAMTVGLRSTWTQELLLPGALTALLYAVLLGAFAYGAWKSSRGNASVVYLVFVVFPFIYAVSRWTYAEAEPRYLVLLVPLLALLFAQAARSLAGAVTLLALACLVSIVTLDRMNAYARDPSTFPPPTESLGPLVSTLDGLGIDRVYTGYETAYRLDFDVKERIIAVMNESSRLVFAHGQATPLPDPSVRWPPYERAVREGVHAFVFYRQQVAASPLVPQLRRYGYRVTATGPFLVYALPRAT